MLLALLRYLKKNCVFRINPIHVSTILEFKKHFPRFISSARKMSHSYLSVWTIYQDTARHPLSAEVKKDLAPRTLEFFCTCVLNWRWGQSKDTGGGWNVRNFKRRLSVSVALSCLTFIKHVLFVRVTVGSRQSKGSLSPGKTVTVYFEIHIALHWR